MMLDINKGKEFIHPDVLCSGVDTHAPSTGSVQWHTNVTFSSTPP